ncbi:hypothetical protein [Nocardioides insulae]|nr:hypothetical protein [Nocardioides insulae]
MNLRRALALVMTTVALSIGIAATATPANADTSWGARVILGHHR